MKSITSVSPNPIFHLPHARRGEQTQTTCIVWLGDIAVPVMETILTTEKAATGGAHRVLLSDELANKLEKYVRFYGTDPIPATVSGKLVTIGDRISVLAELLSPGIKSADIPGGK